MSTLITILLAAAMEVVTPTPCEAQGTSSCEVSQHETSAMAISLIDKWRFETAVC